MTFDNTKTKRYNSIKALCRIFFRWRLTMNIYVRKGLALGVSIALLVTSFAQAGYTAEKTAGEQLKDYGLVSGYANGSLGEGDPLTRAQMMVLLAQLKGESEEAKFYALPSKFTDVDPMAWYAPYVAYATAKGWTAGLSKTKFGPDQYVTDQEAMAFMIKVLGYSIPSFNQVLGQARTLGITTKTSLAGLVTRGQVFGYMLSSLYVKAADGIQLGLKLGLVLQDKPQEAVKSYALATATALNQNLIELSLKEAVTVADAKLLTLKDSTGKVIAIESASLYNDKTLWLRVRGLTSGARYALSAENTVSFFVNNYDISQPTLLGSSSVALTSNKLRVTFSDQMDPETALVPSNYSINGLVVKSAVFEKNAEGKDKRDVVLLTTSVQTAGSSYTLTVSQNVTDLAGNIIKADNAYRAFTFLGLAPDTTAPRLLTAQAIDGKHIRLIFDESSDLEPTTVMNISNYSIADKSTGKSLVSVTAAERMASASGSGIFNEVLLTTSLQTFGQLYEIAVKNIADEFGNVVSETANYKAIFYGQTEDTVAPRLLTAYNISSNKVLLTFSKNLNKLTAEQAMNYSFDKGLTVLKATLDLQDASRVILTTSPQTYGELYKLDVKAVTDQNGNAIAAMTPVILVGMMADTVLPTILSAAPSVENGVNFVIVTFSEPMDSALAKNPQNYNFTNGLGAALDVVYVSPSVYKVKTPAQTTGKQYALSVSGITDLAGNSVLSSQSVSFIGQAVSDFESLALTGAAPSDQKTLTVAFNKPVKALLTGVSILKDGTLSDADASDPDNYKIYSSDGVTLLDTPKYAVVSADRKSVSLRLDTATLSAGTLYKVKVNAKDAADAMDGVTTGLIDYYNQPLLSGGAAYSFMGTSVAVAKPRIDSVAAYNNEEVQIKFTTPVSLDPLLTSDIVFSASGKSTVGIQPGFTRLSGTDPSLLICRTAAKLEASTVYQATINSTAKVKDQFGNQAMDASFGGAYRSFNVPNINADGPRITSVDSSNANQIVVSFNEAIDSADAADYLLSTINNVVYNPTYAEFVSEAKTQVRLYYNPNWVVPGQIYSFKVMKNTVQNNIGKSNGADMTEYYVSNVRAFSEVSLTKSLHMGTSTFRISFSSPVADIQSALYGSDLLMNNVPLGSTITILNAALNGTPIDVTGGQIPINQYFDSLDLKVDKLLTSDVSYQLGFDNTQAALRTKDGYALPAQTKATFNGWFSLNSSQLTNGVNVAQGSAQYYAAVTLTEAQMNLPAVRDQYRKVLTVFADSSLGAYNTNLGIASAFNNANMATAKPKGTTMETPTLSAGTYDFLVVFLDGNDEVIGWFVKKNVSIN